MQKSKVQLKSQNFLSSCDFNFKNKTVVLRIDCDVDLRDENGRLVVDEGFRLRSATPTIRFLKEAGVKRIILLGHLGRPNGKTVPEFSLQPIADWFSENVEQCKLVSFDNLPSESEGLAIDHCPLAIIQNLRFDSGEESNDENFVKLLASFGDVFVNDAFGASHRSHASIVGIPMVSLSNPLPSFLGLNFEKEIETLSGIRQNSKRPLVFVLGGSKSDKVDYLEFLANWADKVLVGGKLPLQINEQLRMNSEKLSEKLMVAGLTENTRDINDVSIHLFQEEIAKAATIIWAGPMGIYEEKENQKGTFEIAKAVAESSAFKVAAGGDTHRILGWLDIWDKFDFISVGGGAMLAFLRDGTLPGIDAIKNKLSS